MQEDAKRIEREIEELPVEALELVAGGARMLIDSEG